MIDPASNAVAWVGGFAASTSTFLGQVSVESAGTTGWLPVIVQSGMAGIVVLIIMKHIPEMIKANERNTDRYLEALKGEREAFRESLRDISKENTKREESLREALEKRGTCPIVDAETTNSVARIREARLRSKTPFPEGE